ncbi:hypothetical protein, partial [Shewanella sairae]|uniref:hypothetical protein n=1 Tax=Shewanella sairae TaxID=190310 RepID=UPI001C7E59A4
RIDQAVENEADIELNGIESLTFIELIEANPSHLSLIEKDLQCISQHLDGTPVLTTFVELNDFKTHLYDFVIKAASEENKSILTTQIEAWEQSDNKCTEVCIDFIRNP